MNRVTGVHELQTIPPVALARGIIRRAGSASVRLRALPIDGLEVAARFVPFATVRSSIAMTEGILRQMLGSEDAKKAEASKLYPGETERIRGDAFTAPPDARTSVRSMVHDLLDRSVRQSPEQALEASYKQVLIQLVPDEARILHTLADGKPRAMEHIGTGRLGGSADRMLRRYISSVGTEAGVRCPDLVPKYLAHLLDLDLIEIGDEEESLREQYEILETYGEIEGAEEEGKSETSLLKLQSVVKEKHSVTISELGKKIWDYAHPDTHSFAIAEQRDEPSIDMSGDLPPEPE
ncbi:Abi-alpha family protein [Skermania sp. ID1734]|uniref:Abi-alpha family protein n=1 Tax=Skermania sp. ID1734 TaxID=2597516 RepID=UPI00163D3ECC|nr:Abi-alpha family protein [Skermania sp. ID1734]